MGVDLTELLVFEEIDLGYLKNKILVVDTPMWMYQFLCSIRQRDGSLLTDSKGNVTSHLTGLFTRISNLLQEKIKLAFVFDGQPPKLKLMTLEKRKQIKIQAEKMFESAKEKEDLELMNKYASRTSRLTKEMIDDAKKLIEAFGLPIIQAPSEAEAQASLVVKKGDAFAIATNDADALLFGSPIIIRNLNLIGKKKKPNKFGYETIRPEMISLSSNLRNLGITHDQLIALALLIGTDFNKGGIKGIGPKTALKLVKKYDDNFDKLFEEVKWGSSFDFSWQEVFELVKNIPVYQNYNLECSKVDEEKIIKLLVEEHDFSEDRIRSQLTELIMSQKISNQKDLSQFFCL